MKKAFYISGLVVLALLVYQFPGLSQNTKFEQSQARNIEPIQDVFIRPLVADMQICGEKIDKHRWYREFKPNETLSMTLEDAKINATFDAMDAYKCDVIVGATYNVNWDNTGVTVFVSGYPARYVNFRNFGDDANDYRWLKEGLFEGQMLRRDLNLQKTEAVDDKNKRK